MSWLYSRALVEEFSAATCSDGEPFAPSSGSPTPQAYLPPDRMTAFSRPSRFGMTFAPLTDDHGAELLTWFLEGFRARTSALQEKAQASQENARACGPTWRGSLAKFDPVSFSWKTVQLSLLGDSELSSVTWPRSGMTVGGQCWELPRLERPTSGTGFGWLDETWPTPRCHMTRPVRVRSDVEEGHKSNLEEVVACRMVATPTARDWKSGKASQATHDRNSRPLSEQIGGSLNPTWVEWLMGWPLGWTDLKPLAMDKSPCALQQHGES